MVYYAYGIFVQLKHEWATKGIIKKDSTPNTQIIPLTVRQHLAKALSKKSFFFFALLIWLQLFDLPLSRLDMSDTFLPKKRGGGETLGISLAIERGMKKECT